MEKILTKLKKGLSISTIEKEFVEKKLSSYKNTEELEQAIRAFGLSNSASNKNIKCIEEFLNSESDIVLSAVVKVLCYNSYWGLTGKYLNQLKGFLKKEDAFDLSETQIAVFTAFGEYLQKSSDSEVFEFIYNMFISEIEEFKDIQDDFMKCRLEDMYHCLDVGIRGRQAEIEYRVGQMQFPDGINEYVMNEVKKLIKNVNKNERKSS